LGGWLRVAAVRIAIDLGRKKRPETGLPDDAIVGLAGGRSPEDDLARGRQRDALQNAFAAALGRRTPEERTLLRLYYIDGVGVARLGALSGTHASTASRAIARARRAILDEVRAALAADFAMPASEIDSLLARAGSVDLTFQSFLKKSTG